MKISENETSLSPSEMKMLFTDMTSCEGPVDLNLTICITGEAELSETVSCQYKATMSPLYFLDAFKGFENLPPRRNWLR